MYLKLNLAILNLIKVNNFPSLNISSNIEGARFVAWQVEFRTPITRPTWLDVSLKSDPLLIRHIYIKISIIWTPLWLLRHHLVLLVASFCLNFSGVAHCFVCMIFLKRFVLVWKYILFLEKCFFLFFYALSGFNDLHAANRNCRCGHCLDCQAFIV